MAGRLMLCAWCTSQLYNVHAWSVRTWDPVTHKMGPEMKDVSDVLALAEMGTTFIGPAKRPFRPLAITQVEGTMLCGPCAFTALEKKGWKS